MKFAIIGYGKMGKAIERLALEQEWEPVAIFDGVQTPLVAGADWAEAEVAIDFSTPDSAFRNIRLALEAGMPVVSGTTGWLERKPEVEALCREKKGRFFYASNFSIGMNLLFALNKWLAARMRAFPQFQASLEEIHHVHKADAPSGTAITLAEGILAEHGGLKQWVLNQIPEQSETLPVYAKRLGEYPGTHTVLWNTGLEEIELKHTAHSRAIFAAGALTAAEWLRRQEPGIYSMEDLLDQ